MKLKHLFILFATTFLLCSCSEDDSPTPVLALENTELDIEANGGDYIVGINSSSQWTMTAAPVWISCQSSERQDQILIKVNENLQRAERSANITITNEENLAQTIILRQKAYAFSENHRYKLPVVFHTLYWNQNNKQHYVEEAQLQKLLERVNYYYANSGVDMNVEFIMAEEDPDGNRLTEPGINRKKWQYTTMDCSIFMGSGQEQYKKLLWDTDRYVNVVLYNFSDPLVMGIAQFPWMPAPYELPGAGQMAQGADPDSNPYPQCVSINNKYIYDLPDEGDVYSMSNVAVTLSHELGHFLGLYHAFNQQNNGNTNTNEDTDYCMDTPPYNKYLYDNALNAYFNTHPEITSKSSKDYLKYVMRTNSKNMEQFRSTNIMDYAISDANRFTAEQAARVKYTLQHALFMPGPKDYSETYLETKGNSEFEFTPQYVE